MNDILLLPRFRRVPQQLLDLGGAVILRVDLDPHNVRALLAADLVVSAAAPLDLLSDESGRIQRDSMKSVFQRVSETQRKNVTVTSFLIMPLAFFPFLSAI